jgi:hypothetical protein
LTSKNNTKTRPKQDELSESRNASVLRGRGHISAVRRTSTRNGGVTESQVLHHPRHGGFSERTDGKKIPTEEDSQKRQNLTTRVKKMTQKGRKIQKRGRVLRGDNKGLCQRKEVNSELFILTIKYRANFIFSLLSATHQPPLAGETPEGIPFASPLPKLALANLHGLFYVS